MRSQWDFPTDFVRPAIPSGNSARVPITLKVEAVKAMKALLGQVDFAFLVSDILNNSLIPESCCEIAFKAHKLSGLK